MSNYRLSYGLTSDKGDVRETNQDAASARLFKWGESDAGLFMVADGMGGKGEGERAAQIAVETVTQMITDQLPNRIDDIDSAIRNLLTTGFQFAAKTILGEFRHSGGGAVLTAAVIIGDKLYVGHVGDTRAYHYADQGIVQLTKDHTLYGSSQLDGDWRESAKPSWILYRALGQIGDLNVDIITELLHPNSYVLLCTNSLVGHEHDYIQQPELQSILRDNDPQAACDQLVTLARERGSTDNITALVVRVETEQPAT